MLEKVNTQDSLNFLLEKVITQDSLKFLLEKVSDNYLSLVKQLNLSERMQVLTLNLNEKGNKMVSLWPKRFEITTAKRAFEHITAKSADRNAMSAVEKSDKTQ